MLATMLAIAPVFVLIMTGYGLRRGGIPSTEFWNLNDKLVYWVLMPALFFAKISASDLSGGDLGRYAGVLCAGFFAAILFGWLTTRRMDPAEGTSVLQGGARFNTFVALAIAEALQGKPGLQAAVLGSALLVPVVNITVVTLLTARLGSKDGGLLLGLVKNPLLISIGAGAVFNLSGFSEVPVLHECARILGSASLPIMLLCVGANLKLRGLSVSVGRIALASIAKFVVFPAAVLGALILLPLDPVTAEVALIFAALPTGVAAYTLARQMGGDAPLMAAIITVQTLMSFVTLPLTLLIGHAALS